MVKAKASCKHEGAFWVDHQVQVLTDPKGPKYTRWIVEIKVRCLLCDEPFAFTGVAIGVAMQQPSTDLDGKLVRLPIVPAVRIGHREKPTRPMTVGKGGEFVH